MPEKRKHRLMGVHVVRPKLADGSRAEYHYAWRGGPRIHAKPGTHAYLVEYTRLTRDREMDRKGLLPELIYDYRQSAAYTSLAEDTKRSYEAAFDLIEAEYCDLPVEAISQRGMRKEFIAWRDRFADTPRKADMLITVLSRVLSVALKNEDIERNPLERIEKLSRTTRRDVIWTDDQMERFRQHAGPAMKLALMLGAWTGQREGDLLRLSWSAYDGSHIKLRQSKSGRRVRVKVSEELRALLDKSERRAVTIISTDRGGRSYTSSGFRASWRKVCERAGIEGVTFHDLRGTFTTLSYRSGLASIAEIAEVTGHSEREAESIIRKHYLAGDAAVTKLETARRSGTKSGQSVK